MEEKRIMVWISVWIRGRKTRVGISALLATILFSGFSGVLLNGTQAPQAMPRLNAAFMPLSNSIFQQTVNCNSNDMKRHWCNVYTGGRVRLIKQKSDSPCIQGRTWGYNQNGIWVDRGCRAEFEVGRGGGGGGGGGGGYGGRTISCNSDDMKRHWCSVSTQGGVRLRKQKSDSPCVQGRTWGYNRSGIWVDRGCRADFEVGGY